VSYDIQTISFVDSLAVESITEVAGASPRALRVVGEGFRSAQRLEVNGYYVDTFTVVNDSLMLVYPGAAFDSIGTADMVIYVLSSSWTRARNTRIVFGPTSHVRKVTGLLKLAQQVLKVLISAPGSNRFSLASGGGLTSMLGASLSPDDKPAIAATVAQAVASTQEQFVAAQTGRRIPADERLMGLSLRGVAFNPVSMEVVAYLRLLSFAGRSVDIPLTL